MQVTIIPIVIGAFGTVTKGLLKGLEDLEVGGRGETIQTTTLLRTARILRRILETWGDLLSLKLQWKTINSVVRRDSKVDDFASSLFLLIIIRSGLLAEIRWSMCTSKSHRSLCVSFSRTGAGLCIYHLFVRSNLNFLHISQGITLPTQSCLVLYSFCANLHHSLIMWLMVSSLSPHSLHLLFCCVLSILALIWLVLTALFCAAVRIDSVSLLKFPFLSHVQVLSCEMLFISH